MHAKMKKSLKKSTKKSMRKRSPAKKLMPRKAVHPVFDPQRVRAEIEAVHRRAQLIQQRERAEEEARKRAEQFAPKGMGMKQTRRVGRALMPHKSRMPVFDANRVKAEIEAVRKHHEAVKHRQEMEKKAAKKAEQFLPKGMPRRVRKSM